MQGENVTMSTHIGLAINLPAAEIIHSIIVGLADSQAKEKVEVRIIIADQKFDMTFGEFFKRIGYKKP